MTKQFHCEGSTQGKGQHDHTQSCVWMFRSALFTVGQNWKQFKCSSADRWVDKMGYVHTLEYSSAIKEHILCPGQCGSVGWSIIPYTKRLGVQFQVRVHAWVAGSVPSWVLCGRQQIDGFFSLSLSPRPFLSFSQTNKHIFKKI